MRTLLLSLFLAFVSLSAAFAQTGGKDDYCKLQGLVYIEQVAAFADYRVFVEDSESFADLVVYKESSESYADAPGLWYITTNKSLANFTIYLEQVKGFADFSVAYTTFRSAIGCK